MQAGTVLPGTNETRFYLRMGSNDNNDLDAKKEKDNVHAFQAIIKRWKYILHCVGLNNLDWELENAFQQLIIVA